jgi:hypothetical protein
MSTSAAAAPIYVLVSDSSQSPLSGCAADNVSGQRGTLIPNSEVEPTLAVNPTNPQNIVAAWQQDRWSGTRPSSSAGSRGNVVASSFDGGQTWSLITQTKHSLCTGGTAANGGDFQRATDPWLSFSPDGVVYLMSLSLDDFDQETRGFVSTAMLVSKSSDGGLIWSDPRTLIRDANPAVSNDKNTITADPNDPAYAYAVWHRTVVASENASAVGAENVIVSNDLVGASAYESPAWFARTIDGGASWEPAREIVNLGRGASSFSEQIVVLPDDDTFEGELAMLFVGSYEKKNAAKLRGGHLAIARSADKGATWTDATVIEAIHPVATSDPLTGVAIRPGRFVIDVAADSTTGALYAVWHDGRFSAYAHNDIAFTMSTDGGHTWATPTRVNRTPPVPVIGNRQAFTPMVSVGSDGAVAVTYYDLRNNAVDGSAGDSLETDMFLVRCATPVQSDPDRCGDPGWSEARLTPTSFNLRTAPFARGLFLGDYTGLDASGTTFQSVFSASNGAVDPATVYFTRASP